MTEQVRNRVNLEGLDIDWDRSPRLPESHPRLVERPDFDFDRDTSTSCGCGYQTFWEVRDDRLYLRRVAGPRYELLGEGQLFADWYSGTATVGFGYDYNSHPMFQSLLHIEFDRGVVIGKREESCLEQAAAEKSMHWTPRLYRIAAGEGFNIDSLLASGADINATDIPNKWAAEGMAPLHFACEIGNKTAVKLFLEKGADVNIKSKEGKTPLDIALEHGHAGVAEILRQHGNSVPTLTGAVKVIKSEHWHAVETKLDLARSYQEMSDNTEAREILKEVLYEGDAKQRETAQKLLLQLFQIIARTIKGYVKAAAQGDKSAHYSLARMYETGDGIPRDMSKAAQWYESAAELGHADAQICLSRMYLAGNGVQIDAAKAAQWLQKAVEWFQKEAAQGNSYAQKTLGDMYMQGNGVRQDVAKAMEWYQKASAQGGLRIPD